MARLLLLSLILLSGAALALGPPAFSRYSPDLKFVSYDQKLGVARFEGSLTLRGMLFFEFDGDGTGHMDGVNFAKFVPIASQLPLLPAVIGGNYPGPVKYLDLPADAALRATVGKAEASRMLHGTDAVVSIPVELVIHDFLSDVECDSRGYFVKHYSVTRIPDRQALPAAYAKGPAPPQGC